MDHHLSWEAVYKVIGLGYETRMYKVDFKSISSKVLLTVSDVLIDRSKDDLIL